LEKVTDLATKLEVQKSVCLNAHVLYHQAYGMHNNHVYTHVDYLAAVAAGIVTIIGAAGVPLIAVTVSVERPAHKLEYYKREATRLRTMDGLDDLAVAHQQASSDAQMASLASRAKSAAKMRRSLPPWLDERFMDFVGPTILPANATHFMRAPMQADHQLAHLCLSGQAVAALTSGQ